LKKKKKETQEKLRITPYAFEMLERNAGMCNRSMQYEKRGGAAPDYRRDGNAGL
jgi:hypothetical protein